MTRERPGTKEDGDVGVDPDGDIDPLLQFSDFTARSLWYSYDSSCEVCCNRVSSLALSILDDDEELDSSIGSVFFPLKRCNQKNPEAPIEIYDGPQKSSAFPLQCCKRENPEPAIEIDDGPQESSAFRGVKSANKEKKSLSTNKEMKSLDVSSMANPTDGTSQSLHPMATRMRTMTGAANQSSSQPEQSLTGQGQSSFQPGQSAKRGAPRKRTSRGRGAAGQSATQSRQSSSQPGQTPSRAGQSATQP